MVTRTATIVNKTGLHARPAAIFAQAASGFRAAVSIAKDGQRVDAKSVLGLMLLAANQGSEVSIEATGEDEAAAVKALAAMLESDFDHGEGALGESVGLEPAAGDRGQKNSQKEE